MEALLVVLGLHVEEEQLLLGDARGKGLFEVDREPVTLQFGPATAGFPESVLHVRI